MTTIPSATSSARPFSAAPIEILCKISRGEKIQAADPESASKRVGIYPTVDQRHAAARILAAKISPDLKSIEHAGPLGEPLSVKINLGS